MEGPFQGLAAPTGVFFTVRKRNEMRARKVRILEGNGRKIFAMRAEDSSG